MKNRILIALIFIPLLVFIYLKGELLFLLFTNVIVGVSLYEFYGLHNVVCYHKVDTASSISNDSVCYNSDIVS